MELQTRVRMTVRRACGTGPITPDDTIPGFLPFAKMPPYCLGKSIRYGLQRGSDWELADGVYCAEKNELSRKTAHSSRGNEPLNLDGIGVFDLFLIGLTEREQ